MADVGEARFTCDFLHCPIGVQQAVSGIGEADAKVEGLVTEAPHAREQTAESAPTEAAVGGGLGKCRSAPRPSVSQSDGRYHPGQTTGDGATATW